MFAREQLSGAGRMSGRPWRTDKENRISGRRDNRYLRRIMALRAKAQRPTVTACVDDTARLPRPPVVCACALSNSPSLSCCVQMLKCRR
jgi:hypothetical protein